jgi:predicted DNA-binding transcriptional regulator YafY
MLGGGPDQRSAFKTVQAAVDAARLLRIDYTNNRLERETRIVEPMTKVFKWRSWYLYAYCRLREDYRLFRISRIRSPEILEGASAGDPGLRGLFPGLRSGADGEGHGADAEILRRDGAPGGGVLQ